MDMGADVEIVNRDDVSPVPPPSDAAINLDESAAAHNEAALHDNNVISIKAEEDPSTENTDNGQSKEDGGVVLHPAKRRKLDNLSAPRRSSSRATSPPWKAFSADGPTTIVTPDGIRKSGRHNREAPAPAPQPAKRSTRNAARVTQTNGVSKSSGRLNGLRSASGPAASSKGKVAPSVTKKPSTALMKSPAARKSERHRRPSVTALESQKIQTISPERPRRGPGRPRKATQVLHHDVDDGSQLPQGYYDAPNGFHDSQTESNPNGNGPRLRLKLRRGVPGVPPNTHPHHASQPPKFPTFADWLVNDDPLEGEDSLKTTKERADEEAERRIRIVDAAENGVLSQERSSIFIPDPFEEPPLHYGHWDHVVSHTLHFRKLLLDEKASHRRIAKIIAREAFEYWKNKYKRKTKEEIEQEEADRAILRYKQLISDVKLAWSSVKAEIDKERVAKWEEEQLQLGHKAMDDMFNQAQEILGRGVVDSASSFVSDDRDSDQFEEDDDEEAEGEDSDAANGEEDDHVMSSSSDSEPGADHEEDEDANLTAEQLREKYGQLPDLPQESSESEDEEEEESIHEGSDGDRTPEPTPDPDLNMEDADVDDSHVETNGFHDDDEMEHEAKYSEIDPATVELDEVDEALLDTEDEGAKSESGSEEWSSEDEDEGEGEEEEGSQTDSDDGDDIGVMGFLAPSEIKKLKDTARAKLEGDDEGDDIAESDNHQVNGVNGHSHTEPDDETETLNINETSDSGVKTEPAPAAKPTPSIEVDESEPVEDVATEKSITRSRSRQESSPPRTEVPSLLRGKLREYQHDGLDWLANLYDSDTNGILADEMGLGKTIQTISLLAYIAINRGKWGPHLIVVPTSVMLNWEMEFKKFLPGFKILTYYGDINERKRKRMGWRSTGRDMYNVVITSYQLVLQDAAAFKMRAWQYLVLDEAHNIKNFKSQRWQTMLTLRTERRLLLTGTPLQNNIDELWSLLYFLMPAGFAGEGRIAGLEEFTMALKNPTHQILEQGRQSLDAEAQKIVKKLHEVLRPYLLRRLKADVEKQMPGKYEHVVYCKLSKRQRQLYDGFMGRASTKAILSSGNYMSIINCLMSLRKVCNHPDLFETRAIVTSMAMPKSVAAEFEIKNLFIRRRLQEDKASQVSLDALGMLFAHRERSSRLHAIRSKHIRATKPLEDLIERQTRRLKAEVATPASSLQSVLSATANKKSADLREHFQTCLQITKSRTEFIPLYGKDIIGRLTMPYQDYAFGAQDPEKYEPATGFMLRGIRKKGEYGFRAPRNPSLQGEWYHRQISLFHSMIPTLEQRAEALEPIVTRFTCVTPAVAAEEIAPLTLSKRGVQMVRASEMARTLDPFHESRVRQSIAFPDKRLLQYDCGKLQRLATLLRDLQAGGHRALIFTQMTKVLDILEQFLNIHGHRYLRLDGATKIEQRQILTDRFNNDPRILCFILSSRSGGLGINLTGADTVIFYDLDWNPAMDKQCQDRSHRIGQTRDVHIYKFVSEYTIEANILRKSNQKRLLDDVIIQKGDFTTDYFNKVTWRDALGDGHEHEDEAGAAMDRVLGEKVGLLGDANVMRTVEDTEDQNAANVAHKEIVDEIHVDQVDFSESSSATPANAATRQGSEAVDEKKRGDNDTERRHVDEYMITLFREEYGKEPYKPPTDRQKRGRKGQDVHRRQKKKAY